MLGRQPARRKAHEIFSFLCAALERVWAQLGPAQSGFSMLAILPARGWQAEQADNLQPGLAQQAAAAAGLQRRAKPMK